jgi:hypothetical protein
MKRIGIFQYQVPITSFTINMVRMFAKSGYFVDLYLYDCHEKVASCDCFQGYENVVLHRYKKKGDPSLLQVVFTKCYQLCFGHTWEERLSDYHRIIDKAVFKKSLNISRKQEYIFFVGIEKWGLLWCGKIAESQAVPYFYYSLELYIEDHPAFKNNAQFNKLRKQEIKYHQGAAATIIQDEFRAAALAKFNAMSKMSTLLFPIAVCDCERIEQSEFLYQHLGIDRNRKILLYFGNIVKGRFCYELAELSNTLPSGFVMVLHGCCTPEAEAELLEIGDPERFVVSRELVAVEDIPDLVASAYIGLLFYNNTFLNDSLTAFSSEKMALYCQANIPVLSFINQSYSKLYSHFRCGEGIENFVDFNDAIERIEQNYPEYRRCAGSAYQEYYTYEKNFNTLLEGIRTLTR